MTAFLWTMIGLHTIGAAASLTKLYGGSKSGADVAGLLLSLSMCGWAGYLLFS